MGLAAPARKNDARRGTADGPAAAGADQPPSFPTPVRIFVLSLLLLLSADMIFIGARIPRTGLAIVAAPVAISLCLALVVFWQARTAERAKQEREEVERKFRNAVEAAHCGIWEWRIREDRVELSDLTGIMFGWDGGGLVRGDDVLARIAPEHRERVRNALTNAAEHGAFDVIFKVPGLNGGLWIACRGQGVGKRDERGYAAIMGMALDVTRERIARARGLAAEARLNDAIESVSEAFALWDRRGRLVMCNRNYQAFFSLDPRLLKPGTSRDIIQQAAEIAVRDHRPARGANLGVREAEMVDGRWLQISERRTSDNGVVMTAADITAVKQEEEARRQNEQALQRAVVRLEENGAQLADLAAKYEQEKIRAQQANAAKSEFLANMSHELRTPLNAINGFSEMMVKEMIGPIGDGRYVEYAQDIHNSGRHLLALINDILDMAKIEAGKHSLRLEDVHLASVAEDAIRLMRNRANDGGLIVRLDMPDLPRVEADHRAVKQVILNLLSNAIKFTPRGGQVRIAGRMVGEVVQISVMDTGIGISKEDLGRLAQPFQQVEHQHAKTRRGTGLGLALSKSLIELHEGRFDMASEPGRGTTVSFTLPLRQRKSPQRPASGKVDAA
jgi:two-component system cell cycle sensor histidine kinase PleC